jgi:hypothetical protein
MAPIRHEKSHTYEEWQNLGFQVAKGMKATGRNTAGKATFKESQTKLIGEDEDYEQDDQIADYLWDIGDR